MKATFKIFVLLFSLVVGFSSCKEDEPEGPQCAFDAAGITVGYYRAYGVGGGIETCQYAAAETWQGSDTHFPTKGSGFIFRLETSVNPVFPSCGELWIKVHSSTAFITGKRYDAIGWVQESGACHTPNITGWIQFSKYDEANQSVSGTFALGDAASQAKRLDQIQNGKFESAPLAILN